METTTCDIYGKDLGYDWREENKNQHVTQEKLLIEIRSDKDVCDTCVDIFIDCFNISLLREKE